MTLELSTLTDHLFKILGDIDNENLHYLYDYIYIYADLLIMFSLWSFSIIS